MAKHSKTQDCVGLVSSDLVDSGQTNHQLSSDSGSKLLNPDKEISHVINILRLTEEYVLMLNPINQKKYH